MKKQIINHIINTFSNSKQLKENYKNHFNYNLLLLDNFLTKDVTSLLSEELDNIPLEKCKHFTRAKSCMYEYNNLDDTPIQDLTIQALHSSTFIKWLENITGIEKLIPDPHLIGAGYAKSFCGDSLKIHSDFNWNEQLQLHRKVSIVIYLNDNWKEEWGGQLNFYDTKRKKINTTVPIKFGNCVIWGYNNLAFHGYPEPIQCPENVSRKCLRLFYYVSNAKHDVNNPPHRSLYWFDNKEGKPYDIKSEK